MTDRIVGDASALVALLVDGGPDGTWAARRLAGADLIAPHLVLFEVANILRRHERSGTLSPDAVAAAHADLLDLPVELWPYEAVATRAWALRGNLTAYDAAYVAVAERSGATLVTLDRRMAAAPGIRCALATPPAG
ncbi:MAG TPA: type II toxin-antitoxin system VapC family toxin [Acidimicrobiales bacterium]|nr:type II toxin-antitoxin system VapC family toxin [Acidimicrobiales bacterium]